MIGQAPSESSAQGGGPPSANAPWPTNRRWMGWAIHFGVWTVLAAAATTIGYLYPNSQTGGASWLLDFFQAELTLVPHLSLMTIGAAELTGLVRRWGLFGWKRFGSYVVGGIVWSGVSFGFQTLVTFFREVQPTYGPGDGVLPSAFLFFIAVAGASSIRFFIRVRDNERLSEALALKNVQLEAQLTEMQLHGLKARLRPHFLFNTHNAIAGLIRIGDRQGALQMLAALSDLLRRSLARDQSPRVPVREEMEFVRSYLGLEQIRFQDRLTIEEDIDPELEEVMIPTMILQPLVENAVRHGIAESAEAGVLRISGTRQNGYVDITIYNDGPTLPADWDLSAQKGIGLRNTQVRLAKHYGDKSHFRIGNAGETGVLVELRIPIE